MVLAPEIDLRLAQTPPCGVCDIPKGQVRSGRPAVSVCDPSRAAVPVGSQRDPTSLAVGETYGSSAAENLFDPAGVEPRYVICGPFRGFHSRLMIFGPFGAASLALVAAVYGGRLSSFHRLSIQNPFLRGNPDDHQLEVF
jgi:hypothetical protein